MRFESDAVGKGSAEGGSRRDREERLIAFVERARVRFEIASLLCRGKGPAFDAQWPEHLVPPDRWIWLRFAQRVMGGMLFEECGFWYWETIGPTEGWSRN